MTIKESTEQQLKSIPDMAYLETEDIANATLYILGTPQNVQVGTWLYILVNKILFFKNFNIN